MKKVIPYKRGSLTRRVLRFLGMRRSVEESPSYQEIAHVPIPLDSHYMDRKEINAALLEAELRKAEALTEWEKRRFLC